MEVVYERCCGVDVHKKTAVACMIVPGPQGRPVREVRTFGTMTDDVLELGDWLAEQSVSHVAIESTGSYWKPLWNLLADRVNLVLVNAHHVRAVPGRKTDVKDSEWLADLLRHGLLRPSFVPSRPQRELRELVRYRTLLVQERSAAANRIQKTLEGANIKLASVATDILGKSGRAMVQALVDGETDATRMAQLAKQRMRAKIPVLERALVGHFGPHQRFLVAEQLAHIDFLDERLARLSAEIAARVHADEQAVERVQTIPGVGRRTAEVLVAEIGTDLARFPTSQHLASWAGMCPGNCESAGKRQSGKTRKGNRWLRSALIEAAHAAAHTKDTYLSAQFRRVAAKRGAKKAAVAVGHTILVIVYHLLQRGSDYQELGGTYFDERNRTIVQHRLVRRLEGLGYRVALDPLAPTASAA